MAPIVSYKHLRRSLKRFTKNTKQRWHAWSNWIASAHNLNRQCNALADYKSKRPEIASRLRPYHEYYVANVSNAHMAVSLETSTFLTFLCEQFRPKRILDMGSGFSSYVLRIHAQNEPNIEVVSVDDNRLWLNTTRHFLESNGVCSDLLLTLEEFEQQDAASFDFAFHDLGNMEVRLSTLPLILSRLDTETAVLVLDDTHKIDYARKAQIILRQNDMVCRPATCYTLDPVGRWASVAYANQCESS